MICSHIETGVCHFLRNKSKTMANRGCHSCMITLSGSCAEPVPFRHHPTILGGVSTPVQERSRAPVGPTNEKLTADPFFSLQIYSESFCE